MLDPELTRNARDLVALFRADAVVSRGHGEQALHKVNALLIGRAPLKLARHEKVVGGAKEPLLVGGHFDDERGLIGRQLALLAHQLLHRTRFGRSDLVVGRREPAEDERKRGDVTGPSGIEAVERAGNLLDRVAVGRFGGGREPKERKDGSHSGRF